MYQKSRCNGYFSVDKWLFFLLLFYEFCGFHHSIRNNRKFRKYLMCTVQFILLLIFTVNGAHYVLAISKKFDILGKWNFVIFYFTILTTYWIVLIESHIQRPAHLSFWKIYGRLEDFGQRDSVKILYLLKYGLHVLIFVIMLIISTQDTMTNTGSILTYYILLFMCNNRLFYYLLYLKLIKFELEQIKHNIKCDCINFQEGFVVILKKTRNKHQRIYELTNCLNVFFGWSQFGVILISFYTFLTYLNFSYQQINGKFEGHGTNKPDNNSLHDMKYLQLFLIPKNIVRLFVDFLIHTTMRLVYTFLNIFYIFYCINQCNRLVNLSMKFE